jgi:hypothetical protein
VLITKLMGDSSLRTVMRHYFDSSMDHMARALARWEGAAGESAGRHLLGQWFSRARRLGQASEQLRTEGVEKMNSMNRPSVGELISRHRADRKLSFGDLARILGAISPREVSKLSQRIVRIEREGNLIERRLIFRIGAALEIDPATMEQAFDDQRAGKIRRWLRWVNEPVPVFMRIKAMPTIWYARELGYISEDEAIRIASAQAKEARSPVCLAMNRKLTIWFDRTGEETGRTEASPSIPNARLETHIV